MNTTKISFKGYDATPLKRIYVEERSASPFMSEIKQVGRAENVEISAIPSSKKWIQDTKVILEDNSKPLLIADNSRDNEFIEQIKRLHGINTFVSSSYIEGGNCFIGTYPNGEKWMLIGSDAEPYSNKKFIGGAYNIKPQNIHFIPQQDYHLDVTMRPIGFPYILVDDPQLALKHLNEINVDDNTWLEKEKMKIDLENNDLGYRRMYSSCDEVINKLKNLGFKPIRIAGVWSDEINFMNAIINKHQDGKISYITNSSKCKSPFKSKLQEIFEQDLRKAIPNLDKIYYIQGEPPINNNKINYLMHMLNLHAGGLHCMSLEEPNFETLA